MRISMVMTVQLHGDLVTARDEGQSRFQGQKVTKCLFLFRFQRVIPLFHTKFHEDFNGYDGSAEQGPCYSMG